MPGNKLQNGIALLKERKTTPKFRLGGVLKTAVWYRTFASEICVVAGVLS